MISIVSGTFTEEQMARIAQLAEEGHLTKGENHFYDTTSGMSWVSHHCWKRGDYDNPRVTDSTKMGIIRFTR
jgi:hypothetical protein